MKLINQEKPEEKWWINCLKFENLLIFAPNSPEQNPVEDIWLQTKNFMIAFYHLCSFFKIVKWLFKFFADGQILIFQNFFSMEFCHNHPEDSYISAITKNISSSPKDI